MLQMKTMPRKLYKSDRLECIVCGADKENQVTLWSFPKTPERKQLWMDILEILNIKSSSRVCEKHFQKNQFVRTKLKKDAVPSKTTRAMKPQRLPLVVPGYVNILPKIRSVRAIKLPKFCYCNS